MSVDFSPGRRDQVSFDGRVIPILFENEDVLAVHKPEGLASIPEGRPGRDCLLSLLTALAPDKLYVVHRLDKDVSGVILFAKNAVAHKCLNEQFNQRRVRKTYIALTHGVMEMDGGRIDKPLRRFGSGRMGVDLERGKPCITEFRVEERLGAYTLVRVHPITGRRHQIRVHLYSIGHPIVGDRLYGEKKMQLRFPRLMLHAQKIALRLPTGEEVEIEADPPPSFRKVVEYIAM